ncbi:MAG: sulfatase-like hydrolase/transferase [Bacteroidetes bacterium]|nr:sulfatase-like hydrolase/transferase [Bacteroidota bacterium]
MIPNNILLIIADQHRQDCLGFAGKAPVKTPNIDRLQKNGISFDNAITPCPLCGPARASLFTSLYSHQAKGILEEEALGARDYMEAGIETDMMINTTSLREPPLLTNALKKGGYYTAYAGKWHLGNDIITDWFEDAHGFDNQDYVRWLTHNGLPETGWPLKDPEVRSRRVPHMSIPKTKVNPVKPEKVNDSWITDIALGYLKERPADKPFFITCGFNGPHPPFMIPEPWYSMYSPDDIPEPPNFHPSDGEPESKKDSFYRQLWLDHGDNWEAWKKSVAVYYGFVSFIDHQVGRLLDELDSQGIFNNTMVIYTSDHGEMLGQHGLWHKMQAYEESLKVPLIISSPTIQGDKCSIEGASLLDIPPTILRAANLECPEVYEGIDLLGNHTEQKNTTTRDLFSEHKPLGPFHGEKEWRMVTDGRYKYIWNRDDRQELYDLKEDPYEMENLEDKQEYQIQAATLHEKLINWMDNTADPLIREIQNP